MKKSFGIYPADEYNEIIRNMCVENIEKQSKITG